MLKVSALPHDIIFGCPAENIATIDSLLQKLPGETDILVLPELFTTGYITAPDQLAKLCESNDGTTVAQIKNWSKKYDTAIAGSFLAGDNGHVFNRAFFIEPDGKCSFYDKKHLFSPSGENKIYSPGEHRFKPVSFRGWNVMLFVCYDLRFPVWFRNYALEYDIALLPANWGEARAYAFKHLLIARAIENQACIVGCNRTGSDDYGTYPLTMSEIFNWWGDSVGVAEGPFVTATLNRAAMDRFRTKFPAHADADPKCIDMD